ncbi:MAG: DNA gyrase subunit A, partial [Candidatus Aureabacteria bacterium]|nr:DNA gyrase subunit A [Candidatus Auribacterota bacterium]
MRRAFIDYSMSVIIGRALPDARDGLKPVHRRILYAMNEMGLIHNRPFKKSARVVGEVLGKYHPHGDASVYEAMVRMNQDFSMRYPLVGGQGNFGSVDGDPPAAMRYTEARLTALSEEMLSDIDKNTVPWKNNFDESLMEPEILPCRVPNLLLNGSSGIAVGMATNIPPHNLKEIANGIARLIDHPQISAAELMTEIKGPDFPTGGILCGREGILQAYETGRGALILRCRATIEEMKEGREHIRISEIPYQVNKANLLQDIAKLVNDKEITGISDLRDESDKDGMRIIIELKRGEIGQIVLNQLFKHTNLQITFNCNMLAIKGGRPKVMGLIELLKEWIEHRKKIIIASITYDLEKAQKRAHILEGFKKALVHID